MGNRISFLPLTLPLDTADPVEHLKAIAMRSSIMKSVGAAELLGIGASWLGAAPPAAQALFWWGIPLVPLPAPLLNLICTNVPGSPTPLYCVGKRMLSSYPHVPTGYELGVGVAVQSYNGKMCFGLTADAVVVSDVKRLRDFIDACWVELCRAAGIRKGPRRSARQGRKPVVKSKAVKSKVAKPTRDQVPTPVAAQSAAPAASPRASGLVKETPPVQPPAPAEIAPALDHANLA